MTINIIVAGPRGKMGSEAIKMIESEENFNLVACIDRKNDGKRLSDISHFKLDVPIYENPENCFNDLSADVFVDLTTPETGFKHTKMALDHQIRTVTGTSGFTNEDIQILSDIAKTNQTGCIIAPNFAIGAVLMMQFSKIAAKYFPDVEIIEKHHDQKLDAPSGTAVKTAELIKETRDSKIQGHPFEDETLKGARGGNVDGMRIHSVRLPGLVAHQEVIFGGPGQTLSIKHDSLNRHSFMDGVKASIEHVMTIDHLIYGLENMLDLNN